MIGIFKRILKNEDIPLKAFAKQIGIGYRSMLTIISRDKEPPRWIKAFNFGYFLGKKSKNINDIEVIDPEYLDCCEKCGMESYLVNVIGCRDENCPEIK